jgi:hypothetical protein
VDIHSHIDAQITYDPFADPVSGQPLGTALAVLAAS